MRKYYCIVFIALIIGCTDDKSETTTRGTLHIYIPESIAPVLVDEVNGFLDLYRQNGARINYTVVTSEIAARNFIRDTAKIAFLTTRLSEAEKEEVRKVSPNMNETLIGYDGIVPIVNPENGITQISIKELRNILSGKFSRWNQTANAGPMKGPIKIYCNEPSDVADYLISRLAKEDGILAKYMHTSSDLKTIRAVEGDPLAIGFTSVIWIDSAKAKIKVLSVGLTGNTADSTFRIPEEAINKYFSPHPANLLRNYYPLKRSIYMYTRGEVNLAGGFGTYVATAEGQKLLLGRGVLPGTQQIKLKSVDDE
jgi:phosphate transport system substrate-binding protein